MRTRIFDKVGMESAMLAADTRSMPDGTEGYEGTQRSGFRAAENRIFWTGDAGLGGSLDDLIAWERHIDATRADPNALYARLSAPVAFNDGRPAAYGFGLARQLLLGRHVTGHGGALRGWSCHRLYSPADRVSVVVAFNHMADSREAAIELLASAVNVDLPARPPLGPAPAWIGAYIEPETELSARVDFVSDGLRLRFGKTSEVLDYRASVAGRDDDVRLRADDGHLWMWNDPPENLTTQLHPCVTGVTTDLAGRYRCDELDAEITVTGDKGLFYGGFSELSRPRPDGVARAHCLRRLGASVPARAGPDAAR